MISLEHFVTKVKPALDTFLRTLTKESLASVETELLEVECSQLQIFHTQILLPLILKLEELNCQNVELQTGIINCVRIVTRKLYIKDVQALKTMLAIMIKQVRDCDSATTKKNLSEEIKLATVECIGEIFTRCTSDVLEKYYVKESALFLGQVLLTLIEFISKEKYRKLINSSLNCLMIIFYVYDKADLEDIVLRSQVADTLFIFLPKIITVLLQTARSDEKIGETLITASVKTLGRILNLMFEETFEAASKESFDSAAFQQFIKKFSPQNTSFADDEILGSKTTKINIEERLKKLQSEGRTDLWFGATSRKLKLVFPQLRILRSHVSVKVRYEYATMCCRLLERCSNNLKDIYVDMLETVIAMTQDESGQIRKLCIASLHRMQKSDTKTAFLFDENAEILFDEHLTKLPRIIHRCDDAEQYAEFLFLKGFLRSLSDHRVEMLLTSPRNLEMFNMCLISAFALKLGSDLLIEEYALREIFDSDNMWVTEAKKFPWRVYTSLNSERTVQVLYDICNIIGNSPSAGRMIFDHLMELLTTNSEMLNEIIHVATLIATTCEIGSVEKSNLIAILLDQVLNEKHWHLSLQPDQMRRLKVEKKTDWFIDRTPGLYESAIEIRKQDYDSDDSDEDINDNIQISDAQFNVLHTCIVLDAVGHCALALGKNFNAYIFRTLHMVLFKAASSNLMVHMSASFALTSIRKSLGFVKIVELIDTHSDYITYHLNTTLKRSPESKYAVDILTVVLQYSSARTLDYLEEIFFTIRNACAQTYESQNIISYLRVFHAFLTNITKWKYTFMQSMKQDKLEECDIQMANEDDLYTKWMNILNRFRLEGTEDDIEMINDDSHASEEETQNTKNDKTESTVKPSLPRHVQMVKDILEQILKFLSSSKQIHQIVALECLAAGLPLLADYENELLPIIHLIWQPLVERFRHKDAVVLNRCFTLFEVLAVHAKDFILKRSLDELIPPLCQFLAKSAINSQTETSAAQTQEYKLQSKLLQEFSNLVTSMQIDGKPLNEISENVAQYLSVKQPSQLQSYAVEYFKSLIDYNGPLMYLIALRKVHLKDFKANISLILVSFGINKS